jgi:hypothetical protein
MSKLAVIASRDADPDVYPVPTHYDVILIGDGSDFEILYKSRAEAAGVPVVVFRPHFKVDKSAEFTAGHFFAANRQKIWNADHVLIVRTKNDETVAAEEYARKLGKQLTIVQPT